ncbi:MAG TPA: DNA-protecting protein DprA [Acidimicrobiaceae bacterium]|nr:DNA-protecting protein DprA [Acidimicrobiaceae bacterium]
MSADRAGDGPDADTAALLTLLSLEEIGPNRLRALLDDRTPSTALAALLAVDTSRLRRLLGCVGVRREHLPVWAARLRRVDGAAEVERHRRAGIVLETPAELRRVPLWRDDPEPPELLFRRGAPVDYGRARVAVVGTRRCSAYGRTMAKRLGAGLAREDVTVVSGLANGIDGDAQRAALDAGGNVVGVVATGLDVVYPPPNERLWHDIGADGTLLSEYPLGTPPAKWRFPARNRLIAALADVVVVVESGATGGSFYTVDAAAERDRPVMAVPGPVTVRTSDGTNRLIAEGCAVARDVDDVLVALGMTPAAGRTSESSAGAAPPPHLDPADAAILDQLVAGAATIDELAAAGELALGAAALALDRLSRRGWVAESGGWWERTR